jgi:prepilin-type N-terminal cleavage/methylation domain-containing protein
MMQRNKGLTFIELMVVISIIGIIAGMVLVSYYGTQKKYALQGAAQKLMADLRQAQSMALAGALYDDQLGGGPKEGGYYVRFTNDRTLYNFAFLDKSYIDIDGCLKPGGGGVFIRSIPLSSNIEIATIELNNDSVDHGTGNILFSPPQPKTCISGDANNNDMEVTLKNPSGETKTIKITRAGVIELE